MVKGYRLLILLLGVLLTASCGTARRTPVVQRDSTVVKVRDSVILRDSVVYVEVPSEQDKAVVPADDSSRLETSVAMSEAWINDGKLFHQLRNKPARIPAPVVIKEKLKTESKEHIRVLWKEKIVERGLSNWQTFQIVFGRIILALFVIYIAIKCYFCIRD